MSSFTIAAIGTNQGSREHLFVSIEMRRKRRRVWPRMFARLGVPHAFDRARDESPNPTANTKLEHMDGTHGIICDAETRIDSDHAFQHHHDSLLIFSTMIKAPRHPVPYVESGKPKMLPHTSCTHTRVMFTYPEVSCKRRSLVRQDRFYRAATTWA